MTLIRKLASVACWVLLSTSYSVCNAQTVDQVTGNIVYTDANPPPGGYAAQGASWTGPFIGTTSNGGGYSGGDVPAWNPSTGTFMFGYNQGTVAYRTSINAALSAAGTGVQLTGFQYSWNYYNQDMSRGSLSGNISFTSNTGSLLQSYNYNMPQTTNGWTNMSGVQTFTTPYALAGLGNLQVSFTGKDDRWWAGYYGPQIKDIDVRLRYGVDPCATNPAYSPSCAGFDKIVESANLVPNPGAYAYGGYGIDNTFSINTALKAAGTGISIHGFKWGYVANANGPYCNYWDMGFMGCWDFRIPSATTNVNITDNTGASIYSITRTYQNSYNTTNYSYLFPASRPVETLGTFQFTGYTADQAYIGSMWAKAIYTPDKCTIDPTSSPTCPGYFKALGIDTTGTTTTTTTTATVDPVIATTTTTITDPVAVTSTSTTSSVLSSSSSSPTASIDPVANPTTSSPSSPSSSVTTASSTPTPSATNPQPKVGEVSTSGSQPKAVSSVSTSQVLSIVSNEQSRISRLETSTAQAATAAAQAAGEQATAESQAVAATSVAQSGASLSLGIGPRVNTLNSMALLSAGVGLRGPESSFGQSFQTFTPRREREEEKPPATENKDQTGNPINNILNQSTTITTTVPQSAPGPAVKKNVKDNDAAGGVTLASIARQPVGFEAYMGGLQDRPFYPPKEIYKGQRTVDNARAQRFLNGKSDVLHQMMVDQQYQLGQ